MREIAALLFSLVLLALMGCTTVGAGVTPISAEIPADRGVVVFSTGADQTSLSFSTALTLVERESYKRYDKVDVNLDYPRASHFPGTHGHVRSLNLKPGIYYFVPKSGNPFVVTTKAPIYSFAVTAGSVTYIGNVLLKSGTLTVSESYQQRDIRYFLDRNPKVRAEQVTTAIMRIDGYISPGSPPPFAIKGIIWDAPQ